MSENSSQLKLVDEKKPRHALLCQICQHEDLIYIDRAYIDWKPLKLLMEVWPFSEREFVEHIRARKLDLKRRQNTEALYQRIIDLGMDGENRLGIKAADVIHAATRIDKLGGRDIERHEYANGPPVININFLPSSGGVKGIPAEVTIQGEVVQELPELPKLSAPEKHIATPEEIKDCCSFDESEKSGG